MFQLRGIVECINIERMCKKVCEFLKTIFTRVSFQEYNLMLLRCGRIFVLGEFIELGSLNSFCVCKYVLNSVNKESILCVKKISEAFTFTLSYQRN